MMVIVRPSKVSTWCQVGLIGIPAVAIGLRPLDVHCIIQAWGTKKCTEYILSAAELHPYFLAKAA